MRESSHICTVSVVEGCPGNQKMPLFYLLLHAKSQMVLPYTLKALETSQHLTLQAICTLGALRFGGRRVRADSWGSETCPLLMGTLCGFCIFSCPYITTKLTVPGRVLLWGHTGVLRLVTLGLLDQLRWECAPCPWWTLIFKEVGRKLQAEGSQAESRSSGWETANLPRLHGSAI